MSDFRKLWLTKGMDVPAAVDWNAPEIKPIEQWNNTTKAMFFPAYRPVRILGSSSFLSEHVGELIAEDL